MNPSVRNIVLFSILILCSFTAYTQARGWYEGRSGVDSLKKVLATQIADTNKVKTLSRLSSSYRLYYPDSSLAYAQQALELAEILDYEVGIFWSMAAICGASILVGNYPLELEYAFKALSLSKKLNNPRITGFGNGMLSDCYYNLGEYDTSLSYWREVMKIIEQWFPAEMYVSWGNLSSIYEGMNQPDSAMLYAKKAYEKIKEDQSLNKYWHPRQVSLTYTCLGNAFAGKAGYDSALFYYRMAIPLSVNNYWEINLIDSYNGVATVYKATGKLDSAVWYAKKVLAAKIAKSYPVSSLKAANLLSDVYELKDRPDSTLKYLRMAIGLKESLFNRRKIMAIQNIHYKEQEKQKEIADSKLKLRNQFIMYFLMAAFIAVLAIVSIVLKNKRQKQLQSIRNSIADDLHDDIGSTLSSISIMSELAKAKSPEASSLLTSIEESTISMQENMSDIVWAIKSENDSFENVLQRMNQFGSEILDAKNIELDFVSDETLSSFRLTMKQRKNLYLFFKEAITNAAKHSDAKRISVHIFQKDHHVEMIIKDNGKGFDTSQTFRGNGMSTLKKRVDELGGYFNIQSQMNEGTVVEVKFKIA
jgi:signal transduction histidine kinase